ncbi:hypothetical protein N7462_006994 [Penicillium macrosclerotiorum]|uniref:uncharacterized protein n=1 Tax=Penicillium macrosclerotiorum TaxID=303699 RepID=UPI0025467A76|nr:uncharacterized protein N7462_006994 [Penicillium macrosclerotiorum]KAJ5678750.1 hypothetical protein N7462_006994 [Penicillium macrosclerotiorum]
MPLSLGRALHHRACPSSIVLSPPIKQAKTTPALRNRAEASAQCPHHPLLDALPRTIHAVSETKDLLAVILTGAGPKAFIGGADLTEMAHLQGPAHARAFISKVSAACTSLRACPVPVIARVNGYALGAGLEVAASCDVRVASSRAVFGMPEVRVGIPSVVEAALLPGLIGWGRTRQMLLLGENIGAEEALRWGLVEKVVEPEMLDEAVEEWLVQLEKNGPQAVRRQKALMRKWENVSVEQAIEAGVTAFEESFQGAKGETSEPARMMEAFLQSKSKSKS